MSILKQVVSIDLVTQRQRGVQRSSFRDNEWTKENRDGRGVKFNCVFVFYIIFSQCPGKQMSFEMVCEKSKEVI